MEKITIKTANSIYLIFGILLGGPAIGLLYVIIKLKDYTTESFIFLFLSVGLFIVVISYISRKLIFENGKIVYVKYFFKKEEVNLEDIERQNIFSSVSVISGIGKNLKIVHKDGRESLFMLNTFSDSDVRKIMESITAARGEDAKKMQAYKEIKAANKKLIINVMVFLVISSLGILALKLLAKLLLK